MTTDLVPTIQEKHAGIPSPVSPDEEEWNLPPELDPSLGKPGLKPDESAAHAADTDAADANLQGDKSFAVIREGDAADNRQSLWDLGDLRTWLWIGAMFAGFLLLVAFVYFMPFGTHNQNDGGNTGQAPTPTIRVY